MGYSSGLNTRVGGLLVRVLWRGDLFHLVTLWFLVWGVFGYSVRSLSAYVPSCPLYLGLSPRLGKAYPSLGVNDPNCGI